MIYCQYHKSLGLVFLRNQTSCSPAASCAHACHKWPKIYKLRSGLAEAH